MQPKNSPVASYREQRLRTPTTRTYAIGWGRNHC